jgi:hypothetical protein
MDRAQEMLLFEERMEPLGLPRRDQLEVHAEVAAARHGHPQPVHALRRAREEQAPAHVNAAGNAGDRLDLLVQVDRVLLQAGDVGVAVEGVHAARGVPARAGGQFGPFDEQDILPARLRQVVEDARPHDTAADHRYPDVIAHRRPQETSGAPPSAVRRSMNAFRASTIAASRGGAT